MVHFKEFQPDDKLFLSVVDKEDDKPQSGSCFLVCCSLRRPKENQTPAIEPSSFPLMFSIRVKKGVEDDLARYFLQSMYHDKSSLLIKFPMLRQRIISGQSRRGANILLYGDFGCFPLY